MKRQSGRYLNLEYYEEIFRLPEKDLFSPSQIVRRKYNKVTQPKLYRRMLSALYRYGDRNGLRDNPDNCLKAKDGKPVLVKGKPQLLPGQSRAKWFGKTWRSHFYDDDLPYFQGELQRKVAKLLGEVLDQKQKEASKPKEIKSPESFPRIKTRRFSMLVVAFVAIAFTAASLYNYNVLNEGYQVMRSQGPKAALEFFQNKGQTYDTLFGHAWAAYRNGNYSQAEEMSQQVLRSSVLRDKARANYLLGDLMTIAGEYEQAREHLLAAHAIYESTGKESSQFRTLLFLAKLYIAQKDFPNAEYYLNLAGLNPKAVENHFYLYQRSQLAFFNHDYDEALDLSLHREKVVGKDSSQRASILSEIGFYFGLTGELEKCLTYTTQAQGLASQQENSLALMYNNINMCLFLKCSNRDYSKLREIVVSHAHNTKDTKLMEQMHFVDKYNCPIPQTDPGHGDPPDDPPPDPPRNRAPQQGREVKKG